MTLSYTPPGTVSYHQLSRFPGLYLAHLVLTGRDIVTDIVWTSPGQAYVGQQIQVQGLGLKEFRVQGFGLEEFRV